MTGQKSPSAGMGQQHPTNNTSREADPHPADNNNKKKASGAAGGLRRTTRATHLLGSATSFVKYQQPLQQQQPLKTWTYETSAKIVLPSLAESFRSTRLSPPTIIPSAVPMPSSSSHFSNSLNSSYNDSNVSGGSCSSNSGGSCGAITNASNRHPIPQSPAAAASRLNRSSTLYKLDDFGSIRVPNNAHTGPGYNKLIEHPSLPLLMTSTSSAHQSSSSAASNYDQTTYNQSNEKRNKKRENWDYKKREIDPASPSSSLSVKRNDSNDHLSLTPKHFPLYCVQKSDRGSQNLPAFPTTTTSNLPSPSIQESISMRLQLEHELSLIAKLSIKQNYERHYQKGQFIRSGGFSEIYHAQNRLNNDDVILKFIPKHKTKNWITIGGNRYPTELALHKIASSEKEAASWVIIIERLPKCLDLFDYMERIHRGRLNEDTARYFFKQLIRINIRLCRRGIVHRDIKSENVLVDIEKNEIVLIDFGASAILKRGNYVDFHGTRQFKPPEYVRTGKYEAEPSTVWALGVLLFDMVMGKLPFENEADILSGNFEVKPFVSDNLRDLIRQCLHPLPERRPTLELLLTSQWFYNHASSTTNNRQRLSCAKNEDSVSSKNKVPGQSARCEDL